MWCHPPIFFFKNLISDYNCRTIDDVIFALKVRQDFFKRLKENGFRLMGPIEGHWVEFEPPDSEDYYWVECRSRGCYLKVSQGEIPSKECPECGKNFYEFQE
jgi:hypothetical protein